VANQGDAWTVTNAYLDRFIDEQRLLPAEAPAESNEHASYLLRMRQIGKRTAELHSALASRPDLPDFAPEPITREDVAQWTEALAASASRTLDDLARRRGQLSEADRAVVAELVERRDTVLDTIRHFLPPDIRAAKSRHHGDFHLGQMLFAKDDVYIIDFEGEPQRSLQERRRKAPPARDVAGLIRSVDYSTTGAFDRAVQTWTDERGRLAEALNLWRDTSVQAFLAAYREALTTVHLWPAEQAEADRLLDFFLLEKAFYEIGYELANRPNWLHIPLAGTRRILFGPDSKLQGTT
jgi:maltose alpha-D-glucosyltransferase/alpha-amylase